LISLYNTADHRLMRNAIEQFAWSIDSTGLTMAAYPSVGSSKIPPFSLFWTMMIKDYHMHVDDPQFVEQYLEEVKKIFDWHLGFYDEQQGVLKGIEYWNFVDWPDEWAWDPKLNTGGMPGGVFEKEISSILNLQFVYAATEFNKVFMEFGKSEWAKYYEEKSLKIAENIRDLCWDADSGLIADTPERKEFSQHANLLAVLSGLIDNEQSPAFIEKISFDSNLIQTTIYYRFYLFEALKKSGKPELYLKLLDPWKEMLKLGLTTFAERQEPTRSDCHAWSASPNYHLLSLVCGIETAEPGFESVKIHPAPGNLEWIYASLPHPKGSIIFQYEGQEEEVFTIYIPENLKATFEYKNLSKVLTSGNNIIRL
ncbi:MAG: alpha-L-rhamnosidase C-terminal domain-containing protein, partial [Bacteroidales bacterium]